MMQIVHVNKAELLEILKKNRDAHRQIFEKAIEGYRRQVVLELEKMVAEAMAGKRIRRSVDLVEPIDQTREYDRAIRMASMEVRDTIELTEEQFSCYVMDDWSWKEQFYRSTANYLAVHPKI